jgi:adenylate cyclase
VEELGPPRKLTTILCADAAGYSRLMRADEEGTYRTLQACRRVIDRLIGEHQGRLFGSAGDSVIAEFASPVEAVRCALEVQHAIEGLAAGLPEDRRLRFRIGINLGDVMVAGDDLIGDGVNVAARLQELSHPGGICISGAILEQIRNKLAIGSEDLGDQMVKNIADPVRVHRVHPGPRSPPRSGTANARRRRRLGLLAAGLLVLLAIASAAAYLGLVPRPFEFAGRTPAASRCARASIAVLPFANLSGDPTQDYFSDGTTEDIIAALGQFSDLSVIARVAVEQYKGKALQPGELSRDLGVCYALEGSVRKTSDRVLVTAQLIDTSTGVLLWSDSYDGDLKDLFAVRNSITQSVVGKLAIKLSDIERQRALKKPTDSLDAYDYVLRGHNLMARFTRSANAEARLMFERAIELDPAYSSAYSALGQARFTAAVSGWTEFRGEAVQQAESLAQKAIELDDGNAEAHALLGGVHSDRLQFDLALSEDDRAIALNPNDWATYAQRGSDLVNMGHPKEAIVSFEVAMRLNPSMVANRWNNVGWAYYLDQRYGDAIRVLEAARRTSPEDYFVHAGLAASYAQLDRKKEAAQAAADVKRAWPFFTVNAFARQFQGDANRALIVDGLHKAGLE